MHNNHVGDAAKFTTVNCTHPGAGSKAVQPADFDKLKKLTAALYETMRFKPVGPVSIRQATQDFNIPPSEDCPSGLSLNQGDTVIAYLEGLLRAW